MNITVEANDFCKDNCPFCELQSSKLELSNGKVEKTYSCRHTELCKFAVLEYKRMFEEAIKDTENANEKVIK